MKFDIIKRLREPPFGTETSERLLMEQAADEISALRAENEQLRDENTKLSDLAETRAEKLKGCPFDRDDFELDLDVPCPVCGSLGHSDSPDLCPYRPGSLGRAALSEAQP